MHVCLSVCLSACMYVCMHVCCRRWSSMRFTAVSISGGVEAAVRNATTGESSRVRNAQQRSVRARRHHPS
jgi:hypothetical protein